MVVLGVGLPHVYDKALYCAVSRAEVVIVQLRSAEWDGDGWRVSRRMEGGWWLRGWYWYTIAVFYLCMAVKSMLLLQRDWSE